MKAVYSILTFLLLFAAIEGQSNTVQSYIKPLGSVDGKFYYADSNHSVTWKHAKMHCNSLGLQLASIDTPNEAKFIELALKSNNYMDYFWTGAKEDRSPQGLVWDGVGSKPNPNSGVHWNLYYTNQDYFYCGFTYIRDNQLNIAIRECERTCRILCQSRS